MSITAPSAPSAKRLRKPRLLRKRLGRRPAELLTYGAALAALLAIASFDLTDHLGPVIPLVSLVAYVVLQRRKSVSSKGGSQRTPKG